MIGTFEDCRFIFIFIGFDIDFVRVLVFVLLNGEYLDVSLLLYNECSFEFRNQSFVFVDLYIWKLDSDIMGFCTLLDMLMLVCCQHVNVTVRYNTD